MHRDFTAKVRQGAVGFSVAPKGSAPPNLSPIEASRSGAFNEAKRQAGIPTSQQPSRVLPNVDKRGNAQPGRVYEYKIPAPGGGTKTVSIREDAAATTLGLVIFRIADPISMTPAAITMTTKIKASSAQDLFVKNEVMNFDHFPYLKAKPLAGRAWQAQASSPHEALLLVLRLALNLMRNRLPHLEFWLLAGSSAWQPNNRLVRHYKLWGAPKMRGLDIPNNTTSMEEVLVESDKGLKFLGAMKLINLDRASIAKIFLEECCAYLTAIPNCIPPSALLNIGWSGELSNETKFIDLITSTDGLLLSRQANLSHLREGLRPLVVQPC